MLAKNRGINVVVAFGMRKTKTVGNFKANEYFETPGLRLFQYYFLKKILF